MKEEVLNYSAWFRKHLQASADGFIWGIGQVPAERLYLLPPASLGDWPAARHVFHMLYYERTIALPSMGQWLGGPGLSDQELRELDEDAAWAEGHEIGDLKKEFRAVRDEQIGLLSELSEEAWHEKREAVWGPVSLLWVVSKTYQHTAEHTNDLLRIALFWDLALARKA